MNLQKISEQEIEVASRLLADYWKDRDMPEYDQKWAKGYLEEGHKKEIVQDEFFIYKENNQSIGLVSLITDVSNVAEIRDMVVRLEYRRKGYGKKILNELIEISKKRKIRKLYALVFPKYKGLFQLAGFEKEGVLKSHFKHGENLIIMSKFIEK